MYHFLSGYTAKVAGTEKGRDRAEGDVQHLLRRAVPAAARRAATRGCSARRSRSTSARVWLVNTGWTGGPYGVGKRMKIAHTRAMIRAALVRRARQRRVREGSDLQPRHPDQLSRRAGRRAEAAQHLGRTARTTTRRPRKLARMFVDNFKTFEDGRDARRCAPPGRTLAVSRELARVESPELELANSVRSRHRPRDPRAAADRVEDLLRLQHRVRRARRTRTSVRSASACRARCRS